MQNITFVFFFSLLNYIGKLTAEMQCAGDWLPDIPHTLRCWLSCHFISLAYLCHLLSSHTCSATYKFPFQSTSDVTDYWPRTSDQHSFSQYIYSVIHFHDCTSGSERMSTSTIHPNNCTSNFYTTFPIYLKNELNSSLKSFSSNSRIMNAMPSKFINNFHAQFLFLLLVPSLTLIHSLPALAWKRFVEAPS